jgi:hypothetical protein
MGEDGRMHCLQIACEPSRGCHTGDQYNARIKRILTEFDPSFSLVDAPLVVHNSAPVMLQAFQDEQMVTDIPCFDHLLSLATKRAFTNCTTLSHALTKAEVVVNIFANRSQALERLKKVQETMISKGTALGLTRPIGFVTECPTRFMYSFLLLESVSPPSGLSCDPVS